MAEGVAAARRAGARPAYWWFTDADIEHADDTLARLVATAQRERRDLVSLMVELHCAEPWERLLIPAFVILVIYGYLGSALLVFATAGMTDGLDGLIARASDQRIPGVSGRSSVRNLRQRSIAPGCASWSPSTGVSDSVTRPGCRSSTSSSGT